jgi:hypothetical protein
MINKEEMQQIEDAQYGEMAETIERLKGIHRRYWDL